MILLDLSQVMISNIMVQLGNHTNTQVDENMVRHMVLNSIRMYKTKFGAEYGELIIACDNKNSWRKQLFPYYKANRKKNRESSDLNWKDIFDCLGKIKAELKEYFHYCIIDIETVEADDVIATLCMEFGSEEQYMAFQQVEPIIILSGDKDFVQLQRYKNVKQFDPIRKSYKTCTDPVAFLKEHIIKGDTGDGIPNFLSADNCLVVGDRQKPVLSKKLDQWIKMNPEEYCDTIQLRNYKRNEQLIDLTKIPDSIYRAIVDSYNDQRDKKYNTKLFEYFMANRLKNLMENIGDFK